ncbi:MAG: hypothetical protein AAF602_11520 [Myxococcota bacterium]
MTVTSDPAEELTDMLPKPSRCLHTAAILVVLGACTTTDAGRVPGRLLRMNETLGTPALVADAYFDPLPLPEGVDPQDPAEVVRAWFGTSGRTWGIDHVDELVAKDQRRSDGFVHVRVGQMHDGFEVFGAEAVAHVWADGTGLESVSARLVADLPAVPVAADDIGVDAAFAKAGLSHGARVRKGWFVPALHGGTSVEPVLAYELRAADQIAVISAKDGTPLDPTGSVARRTPGRAAGHRILAKLGADLGEAKVTQLFEAAEKRMPVNTAPRHAAAETVRACDLIVYAGQGSGFTVEDCQSVREAFVNNGLLGVQESARPVLPTPPRPRAHRRAHSDS